MNEYCMSNMSASKLPKTVKDAYRNVYKDGWAPLFDRFDKIKHKSTIFLELGENRYLSWNFGNVTDKCGTVEFRRPPGVRSAQEAIHWAGFTLGFIFEALHVDWEQARTERHHQTVDDLQRFVYYGVYKLEPTCLDALINDQFQENYLAPIPYTENELRAIKRVKERKKGRESPFVEMVNSRPNTPASVGSHHRSHSGGSHSSRRSGRK